MFINYSQTFAATITTFVGFLVLILAQFNIQIAPADLELFLGTTVTFIGLIWQLVQRYRKGDVTVLGTRRIQER